MRSKILVIGGTGLVGNALVRSWTARGAETAATAYRCHASGDFLRLDMRDDDGVRTLLEKFRPAIVAVPAANPFVDYCEQHPHETRKINVDGTLAVARGCREIGARMIFYSSDYVYDGVKGIYTEQDAPSPINEYGRQKAATEVGVLAVDPANLIIRTSGVYGWQLEPKNFVLQILARLSRGETMDVADDIRYNPTYAENLAEITIALVESGAAGIFHVVGAEKIVRHEFAVRAAKMFGLDASLLHAISNAALTSTTPRPKESSLHVEKARAAVEAHPLKVDEGLRRMLAMEPIWRAYVRTLSDSPTKAAALGC